MYLKNERHSLVVEHSLRRHKVLGSIHNITIIAVKKKDRENKRQCPVWRFVPVVLGFTL